MALIYRGYEVYDPFLFDQAGAVLESLDRRSTVIENPAGRFGVRHEAAAPKRSQSGLLRWCGTRTDVALLEAFLRQRMGRYRPFWVPSWTTDVELLSHAADAAGRTVLTVESALLARARLNAEGARDLVGLTYAGAVVGPGRIVSATDNADGTESITLDVADSDVWDSVAMVSWLRFVRLAQDEAELHWQAPDVCSLTLDVVDCWEGSTGLAPDPVGTVLYWRLAAPAAAPSAQQSTKVMVSGTFEAAGSLSTTKGSNPQTFGFPGTGAEDDTPIGYFPGKLFVSDALAAQTVRAQPWLFGGAARSGAVFAHSTFAAAIYLYRPATDSVVAMLYDADAEIGGAWDLNAPGNHLATLSLPQATTADGDVLVLEVFNHRNGGSYFGKPSANYDGAVDIVEGGDPWAATAAFLRSTYRLSFLGA